MSKQLLLSLAVSLFALGCLDQLIINSEASVAQAPTAEAEQQAIASPQVIQATKADWRAVKLRDVRSGEEFAINDFKGKVVLLELFAVWCPLCEQQQREMAKALPQIQEKAVLVSLDIDPNENEEQVRSAKKDFGWRFAVDKGLKVGRLLEKEFGPLVLSPPSTPLIVIDVQGGAENAGGFGSIKPAEKIVEIVNAKASA